MRKVREQDYSARTEIEAVRQKSSLQYDSSYDKKPNPVTYPLGFNSTEKSLAQARGAIERYKPQLINNLEDLLWTKQVVREFRTLRKVSSSKEENRLFGLSTI